MDWAGFAWRAVLAVGAVAAVTALIIDSDASTPALVAAAALLVVTGAVVDRALAALVPPAAVLAFALFAAITDPQHADGEQGWMLVVTIAFVFAMAASVCLLIGAGLRHAVTRRSRHSSIA